MTPTRDTGRQDAMTSRRQCAMTALVPLLLAALGVAAPGPAEAAGLLLQDPAEEMRRDTLSLPAALEAGEAAWSAGEVDAAQAAYARVLELAPDQGVALLRMGLLRAWDGDYGAALGHLGRLVELQPDNVEARLARARVTAWSGDTDEAVAMVDQVLADRPGDPDALEARATFLSWGGDVSAAVTTYDRLLGVGADPGGVRRSQARILAGAGDYDEAEAAYQAILDADPDDVEALQGLARVRSWAGRLRAGEESWRRALEVDPDDVTSRAGLAQNLRWQGRNAAAKEVLDGAGAPLDPEIQEQRRWVEAALGTASSVTLALEGDSDDNRMLTTSAWIRTTPWPRLSVRGDVYRRDLSQFALDRTASGVNLSASWLVEPGWIVSGGVGGNRNSGTVDGTLASWRAALSTPRRHAADATVAVSGEVLDATALLAENAVTVRELAVEGGWTPAPGWRLSGEAGQATFQGSEDNDRTRLGAAVTRRLGQPWTVGVAARTFAFERDVADGYFDPDRFVLLELPLRWQDESGPWVLLLEGAPGSQRIRTDGPWTGAVRVSGRATYRFDPGREVALSLAHSTAGVRTFRTEEDNYRYWAVVLSAAWVF